MNQARGAQGADQTVVAKIAGPEWFARPDPEHRREGDGLRFSCTMCGNCCSGPEGYVLVSDGEAQGLAGRLGMSVKDFLRTYTRRTSEGRSLTEKPTPDSGGGGSLDCVFLDRHKMPGKAVCGVYEHRPAQCRTWPFWPSVIKSRATWERSKRVCPGMDKGKLHTLVQIRVARDACEI